MQNALITEDLMRPVYKYLGQTDSLARAWAVLLETHDDDVPILDRDLSPECSMANLVDLLEKKEKAQENGLESRVPQQSMHPDRTPSLIHVGAVRKLL